MQESELVELIKKIKERKAETKNKNSLGRFAVFFQSHFLDSGKRC